MQMSCRGMRSCKRESRGGRLSRSTSSRASHTNFDYSDTFTLAPDSSYLMPLNDLYASLPVLMQDPPEPCETPSTSDRPEDPFVSRVLLTVLCNGLARQMRADGQHVRVPWLCSYRDFVRVSKAIMLCGRTPMEQEALVRRALNSMIPGGHRLFRMLLGRTGGTAKWAHELNALAATLMFPWLVGEMEVNVTQVTVDGQIREQRSVAHIKKCRFLEEVRSKV